MTSWRYVEFILQARFPIVVPMMVDVDSEPDGLQLQRKCLRIASITLAATKQAYPAFGAIA